MVRRFAFILFTCALVPNFGHATCSRANLTRCLDSACAINISSNPAARCQYCGCADVGGPKDSGMRTISAGTSARFTISSRDLKDAPADAGERYIWASQRCIEMVTDCTADDISDVYDPLIEQSCTAMETNTSTTALAKNANDTRGDKSCKDAISLCMVSDTKCTPAYTGCASDTDFDRYFSECAVASVGCDEYLGDIRADLIKSRNGGIATRETVLARVIERYRKNREDTMTEITKSCQSGTKRDECILKICNRMMPNKCDANNPSEKSTAAQLCKYYDTACATLK